MEKKPERGRWKRVSFVVIGVLVAWLIMGFIIWSGFLKGARFFRFLCGNDCCAYSDARCPSFYSVLSFPFLQTIYVIRLVPLFSLPILEVESNINK